MQPLFCWASGLTVVRDRDASLAGFGVKEDFMEEEHLYEILNMDGNSLVQERKYSKLSKY